MVNGYLPWVVERAQLANSCRVSHLEVELLMVVHGLYRPDNQKTGCCLL